MPHRLAGLLFLGPASAFGQLFPYGRAATSTPFKDCTPVGKSTLSSSRKLAKQALTSGYEEASSGQSFHAAPVDDATGGTSAESGQLHFHWVRALTESFTFLVIEQAYVVHTDFRWVVSENGIPFNHHWRDYKQSISEWTRPGWDDGDPNWFGYVGHPIQGL